MYVIQFNADGTPFGCVMLSGVAENNILEDSEVECTEDQFNNYLSYRRVNGVITLAAVADLVANAQPIQSALVDAACAAAIVSGFTCDALVPGTPYTYPSKLTDQANLSDSVLSSLVPGLATNWTTPFWCADETGTWGYREHTAAQIQAVGVCRKTMITVMISKKITLEAAIAAAATVEAVQAVVWR
ncbi:hypothetical protein HK44_020740 [Pseudomonas fluorescens HK44]|uniref:DUF4376 domain-containing protein n=1 Tax=Pseudomonas fluorescens HK44 TaxID=1042209 RepID=A0A010TGU9_PSEFL|nr:hypothetical protein [Pseudomonas fluorescens]EXF96292.1 hypothetical protein HK44_020740 [Pseudomonas fluorescens HK44]